MVNSLVEEETEQMRFGLCPKYLRHNLWTPDVDPSRTAADWTMVARPLARPFLFELEHPVINQTLSNFPHLFRIVTPVNVEAFERLLRRHPNRAFVDSVLDGFRFGFWPWAKTIREDYPLTHDESRPLELNSEKEAFLTSQLKHEQELGRVSEIFGNQLLPGMYCMPNYVVPKPHSTDWRLVNDLSAGKYSLNGMVDRQFVTGYPLDNLMHLGELILRKHKENPGERFVVCIGRAKRGQERTNDHIS